MGVSSMRDTGEGRGEGSGRLVCSGFAAVFGMFNTAYSLAVFPFSSALSFPKEKAQPGQAGQETGSTLKTYVLCV